MGVNKELEDGINRLAELAKKIGSTNCYNREPEWQIEMNVLASRLTHHFHMSSDELARMVADKLNGKNPFTARWQTDTPVIS